LVPRIAAAAGHRGGRKYVTLIEVVGLILIALGLVSIVALLWIDLTKPAGESFLRTTAGIDLPGFLGKVPARYLPSVVMIILGWAMYDPTSFKKIWAQIMTSVT
jgi:hypothetical protein